MAGLPFCVGSTVESAGRSTTGRVPKTIFTLAITAPVFPALTIPEMPASRMSLAATRIDESLFLRAAVAADSSMVMTSLAWTTSMAKLQCHASAVDREHDLPAQPAQWEFRIRRQLEQRHRPRLRAPDRCPSHRLRF